MYMHALRVPVTALLILANLAVFLAMLFNGAGLWHSPNTVQLRVRRDGATESTSVCAMHRAGAAGVLALALLILLLTLPPPRYRWRDELMARATISRFVGEESQISSNRDRLIEESRRNNLSFEQLAGRIDAEIARQYELSFEHLSSMNLEASPPSARNLDSLRRYAELRRDSFKYLAEGLRTRDQKRVQEALQSARKAPTNTSNTAGGEPANTRSYP